MKNIFCPNIERKILSYLENYGNTKESDLISYGVNDFGQTPEEMKRAIDCLMVKGAIHRIVHNKLKPPEVYVTLQEPVLPEIFLQEDNSEMEVKKILDEAASQANQVQDETGS